MGLKRVAVWLVMMMALCALTLFARPVRAAEPVLVFAAASMKTALDSLAKEFEAETGQRLRLSYASSALLARQIERGAPARVFISANTAWMDRLQAQNLLQPGWRTDVIANRLVLIAPQSGTPQGLDLEKAGLAEALIARLQGGRLAVGLIDSVPAGLYARQALQRLGVWQAIQPHLAQTPNVRAALSLVASGAAPLGLVYASDAWADQRVAVLASIPPQHHDPIVYPMALLNAASMTPAQQDAAQAWYGFLEARRADFAAFGFAPLVDAQVSESPKP